MSCQITKEGNKVVSVLNEKGQPSSLWSSLDVLPFLTTEEKESIFLNAQKVKGVVLDAQGEPMLFSEKVDDVSRLVTSKVLATSNLGKAFQSNEGTFNVGFVKEYYFKKEF